MMLFVCLLFGLVHSFEVVGYLPEYRYGAIKNWDGVMEKLTQLILFSLEVNPEGDLIALDRFPSPELLPKILTAADKHDTKVLLCLGGNSRTGGFPTVATVPEVRTRFIANVVKFLLDNGLHGLDLNWEYPQNEPEWRGLFEMIVSLKNAFKKHNFLLTMAIYPGQEKILHSSVVKHLDYIHTMVYDQSGRHSTPDFARKTIRDLKDSGLPLHKFTLGLPFYGRHVQTGEAVTYSELFNKYHSQVPKNNELNSFYYNGVKLLREKTVMASKAKLGGVMIWEIGQDIDDPNSRDSLLNAVDEAAKEKRSHTEL